MGTREEALRRFVEASARLTDDQRRELLAHLEDSVEEKLRAGASQPEAIGRAIEEMGDLEKIARKFPPPGLAAVTPEGVRLFPSTSGLALGAYTLLVVFTLVQVFVTPKFMAMFDNVNVPMPGLTCLVFQSSLLLSTCAPFIVPLLLTLGLWLPKLAHWRTTRRVSLVLIIALAIGCLSVAIGLCLPLATLLQGLHEKNG